MGRHLRSSNEATCRFTCVTACCFAVWELTTFCYQNAAPACYRVYGQLPERDSNPLDQTVVTAYGHTYTPDNGGTDRLVAEEMKQSKSVGMLERGAWGVKSVGLTPLLSVAEALIQIVRG